MLKTFNFLYFKTILNFKHENPNFIYRLKHIDLSYSEICNQIFVFQFVKDTFLFRNIIKLFYSNLKISKIHGRDFFFFFR